MEFNFKGRIPREPRPISSNTSTTSLESLCTRTESASTTATTPSATVSPSFYRVPEANEVSQLLRKRIESKTVVLLVGLPASGKSTVCKQMSDFLERHDYKSSIYNAGNIRRQLRRTFSDADFFNPDNRQAHEQREQYAAIAMESMLEDFRHNRINVGFLDATNTTRARRDKMINVIRHCDVSFSNVIVLDVACTDDRFLAYNVNGKASNGDYLDRTVAEAIADFKQRSEHYYKVFQTITPHELEQASDVVSTYIKIHNARHFQVVSEKRANEVESLFVAFASNYYKFYGEAYHKAVDAFYGAIKAKSAKLA